ncbi:hypothetical protein [Streptomyces sp. NPDC007205]|uniref:hypothetical protein n=1 Tax=Streptomyces sp. NPDC007205 TaxID=3154316 RepID=UPI0033EC0ABA
MTAQKLPKGWKLFRSNADNNDESRWYATAPYDVEAVKRKSGLGLDGCSGDEVSHPAWNLDRTVSAGSWGELCALVAAQVTLYEQLSCGGEE